MATNVHFITCVNRASTLFHQHVTRVGLGDALGYYRERISVEAVSVFTCIDGYEMARQGRAGPALMIAAVGSFIGGTFSIVGLMLIAPPLAKVMIAIGPSVEVVLMLLALSVISVVSAGSRVKTVLRCRPDFFPAPSVSTMSQALRVSPSDIPAGLADCRSRRSRSVCSVFRKY
jgi:hypothetical protein